MVSITHRVAGFVIVGAVVVSLCAVGGFLRGRGVADAIAAAESPQFMRTGAHFVRHAEARYFCWVFSYEDEHIVTSPCHVFTSVAGSLISQEECDR